MIPTDIEIYIFPYPVLNTYHRSVEIDSDNVHMNE